MMMNKFPIDLDLNERERSRFSKSFRELEKAANELATAIENNDNPEIFADFLVLTYKLHELQEFKEIITGALKKAADQSTDKEFPEFIKKAGEI